MAIIKNRNKRRDDDRKRPFLNRLLEDNRGNTLIIVAAAILPLLCLMGSGIDMGRAYMANARLQQACDAAALAGRRVMTTTSVDSTVIAEATKFFNFNFTQGSFGTAAFTPSVTGAANSTVVVTASTTIPTTIMRIFGFATIPLSTTCNARQDFVNTDILLVLDTTGSMACDVSGNNCNSGSTSKIVALRAAVLALYDQLKPVQDSLTAAGLRLRYGVVPYASGVNVGKAVRDFNASYIASDNWIYQSRQASFKHVETKVSASYCDGILGATKSNQSGSGTSATYTCTYNNSSNSGGTTTFSSWTYAPTTYDISNYVAGNNVTTLTGTSGAAVSSTWAGCIEERATVNTITSSTTSIPSSAYDLDIDMVPTSDKTTKWKPFWPEVEYLPTNAYQYGGEANKPQWACPAAASRLKEWTRSDLSTYLNTLNADGGTYHDNGMIWGARFISPTGIFSSDNPTTYGNMPVSRYIIFMTDGLLDTGYDTLYTTYGVEKYDARVTPGSSSSNETDQASRHQKRFNLLCDAVKGKNISIWIVAFAQSLDTNLTNCATNAAQASTSANSADLNARFVQIGKNIGSLRLTK